MSSSFFIRKSKASTKRNNNNKNVTKAKKMKHNPTPKINRLNNIDSDEISSDEDSVSHHSDNDSDNKLVTAQERKVILAKKYLDEIEKEEKERLESGDIQSKIVTRLREDILDQSGKLNKKIADTIIKPEDKDIYVLRCKEHKLSITCIVISPDSKFIFSGSKDGVIVKWSIENKNKVGVILSKYKQKDTIQKKYAHNSSILSLSLSFDNKYLASSDESSVIQIWNAFSLEHLNSFTGHRGSVTGLAFCTESNILYSCSKDRSVRVWNVDEMTFVETLFGHQCSITDIDVLKKDRAVTSGGSDSTLRVWKIQEESQLIFNGHTKNIDRVRRLDQQHFVSCGDDGLICLWGMLKKKPLSIVTMAHGSDLSNNEPNWITSLSCFPNSDLIVSGSNDGHLRFWKCDEKFRTLTPLFTVPIIGFVNSMSFSKDGNLLVIGIGQEPRLGRWYSEKKAKNSILVICLPKLHRTES